MPSLGTLPQELVDEVIDKLGESHRDTRPKRHIFAHGAAREEAHEAAREALHACTLVSKNWTGRSRAHLFNEVKIRAGASRLFLIPPKSLMRYVTKLEMEMRCERYRLSPSPTLLRPFHAAPITSLAITNGTLASAQAHLVECITALSATLHAVTFSFCSLSPNLIFDIALRHPDLKQLHLHSCQLYPTTSDHHAPPRLDPCSTDLELGIISRADVQRQGSVTTMVARLPIRFSRLYLDYLQCPTVNRSLNTLIEANAESLSSLIVHIIACTSKTVSSERVPSLTTKLSGSGALEGGERTIFQPGRLFQFVGAGFLCGGHRRQALVPHSNLN